MDRDEFVLHWNSFCNLAAELEETQRYVYHGLQKNGENYISYPKLGVVLGFYAIHKLYYPASFSIQQAYWN